jgi:hypothetical protein
MQRAHRTFRPFVHAFNAALLEPPILQTIRPKFRADKDALNVGWQGAAKACCVLITLALCNQRSGCACGSGNSGFDESATSGAHLLSWFVLWIQRHHLRVNLFAPRHQLACLLFENLLIS